MDSVMPGNDGFVPANESIHSDSDTAYMTTFPVRLLTDACNRKGIAAKVSNSAGTFVCDRVYYEALYSVAKGLFTIKALFVHLPYIREQEKSPSMDKSLLAKGIADIIKEIGNMQINDA